MFVLWEPKNEVDILVTGMSEYRDHCVGQATNIVKEEALKTKGNLKLT